MDNQLIVSREKFPLAKVPGATTLEQVFEEWRARGLKPVEVTSDQFVQHIKIEHDTAHGQLSYTRDGADALQTIALLWDTIVLVAKHELFSNVRSQLNSGKAAIALSLDGNSIEAIHDAIDPTVLKGLLVADLVHLCVLTSKEEFDAAEMLGQMIRFQSENQNQGTNE